MNGRAYDYNLGRFLSVDPFIQAPGNSQSMNPYSYIMNNPLAGTDPSGYMAECEQALGKGCGDEPKPERRDRRKGKGFGWQVAWVNPDMGNGANTSQSSKTEDSSTPEDIGSQSNVSVTDASSNSPDDPAVQTEGNDSCRSAVCGPDRFTEEERGKILSEINEAVSGATGKDYGNDPDRVAKELDDRLYDIGKKYNIEISALVIRMENGNFTFDGVSTSFWKGTVTPVDASGYDGAVGFWHNHPGGASRFSLDDLDWTKYEIKGHLTYVSSPKGLYKYDYNQYISDLKGYTQSLYDKGHGLGYVEGKKKDYINAFYRSGEPTGIVRRRK